MSKLVVKIDNKVKCVVSNTADKAILSIDGEISWWKNSGADFKLKMAEIRNAGITNLHLELNSPGGSVIDANNIYNELVQFEGTRTVKVGALCASCATIVLMAFPLENRTGAANSQYMAHNPTTSMVDGEAKDFKSTALLLDNIKEGVLDIYEPSLTLSRKKISDKMDDTWWLTAKKAKETGFISEINDKDSQLPSDAAHVFNKYNFENVPEILNSAIEKINPTNSKQIKTIKTMKNFILALVASMPLLKNKLGDDDSEKQIVAVLAAEVTNLTDNISSITAAKKVSDDKVVALEKEVKNHGDLMITAVLDIAEKEQKKITNAQRLVFEKQADKIGLEGLNNILATISPRKSIKDTLEKGKEGNGEGTPQPKNFQERMYLRMAKVQDA